jgi:Tol biopolymer transport system component
VHIVGSPSDTLPNGVYVIGADGGGRRLVREERARSVDWSPDGRRLVYDTLAGLYTCTSFGDSVEQVLAGAAYFPSWSPLGDRIAFDDITHVWTIPVVGGTRTCVTATIGGGRDPDWSPDGSALVILAGLGSSGGEVATITATGTLLSRVTNDSNEDRSPVWAPAPDRIAWSRWVQGSSGHVIPQFWIADTSGAAAHLLLTGEGSIDWAPGGTRLVLSRQTGAGSRLFTIKPDGTALIQITH